MFFMFSVPILGFAKVTDLGGMTAMIEEL